jgi:hypothetical protein
VTDVDDVGVTVRITVAGASRCGSKTSNSGHEGGQSARLKRAITGLMHCNMIGL